MSATAVETPKTTILSLLYNESFPVRDTDHQKRIGTLVFREGDMFIFDEDMSKEQGITIIRPLKNFTEQTVGFGIPIRDLIAGGSFQEF